MAHSTAKYRIVGISNLSVLTNDAAGAVTAVRDRQTITITGSPTGGTFPLTFNGQTAAGIAYNATAADVKNALEALSNVNENDVDVTGGPGPGSAWVVNFQGALAGPQSVMTTSSAGLTGGTSPAVAVVHTTPGVSGEPGIVITDIHFANQVTWDPQTSEINFEGDDQQVRRTYLNGINVAIRADTYDLAAVAAIFDKDEVTTVPGSAGRTYFGDTDEVAGAACGLVVEARAENLITGENETLKIVSPKGRMQVVKPPTFAYNSKAPLELTYAAEKTSTDISGYALPGVPDGGALWYIDRIE